MPEQIKINVGGKIFVTTKASLNRFPETKLAQLIKNEATKNDGEIYFDKNPKIFQCVLDYYRSGKLHINSNYCSDYIKEELHFWEVSPTILSPCCRKNLFNAENEEEGFSIIEKNFGNRDDILEQGLHENKMSRLKQNIWNFIEYPLSSKTATACQVFYLMVVFCGIISCSIHCFLLRSPNKITESWQNTTDNEDVQEQPVPGLKYVLILSYICNTVFAIETTVRVTTCPNKKEFFKSLLNLIDVGCVMAYLVYAILSTKQDLDKHLLKLWEVSATLMIFQGFRFYRMERFCERLRLILLSLNQSKSMLCLLTTILVITALIFAALIHILEIQDNPDFNDPITCFYWAIITMATVGYGDVRPYSPGGKMVASLCATIGLLLLSMPIAIVANDFSDLYSRYKSRKCYERQFSKKKKKCVA